MMNQLFDPIISILENLPSTRLKQVMGVFIGTIFLAICLLVYQVQRSTKYYSRQMSYVNDTRHETAEILAQNERLAQQQARVETMLAQDKNFKLKEFVDTVIQKVGLKNATTAQELGSFETVTSRSAQYTEVQLTLTLNNINTKQLVDCLAEFEGNERVYLKKIEITKQKQQPAISVIIVVATLTPALQNVGVTSLE